MRLPETDVLFQKSARKGHYQRNPLFQAMSVVIQWDVAVDVGAHVGFMSRDMAHFFDLVHAFEPQPDNFECLEENTEFNVICHRFALGDHFGSVGLRTPLLSNSGAWEVTQIGDDADIITLDSFHLKKVGLIKIDTQGSELQVLKGAKETLLDSQPIILAECTQNGELDREPVEYLLGLGAIPLFRVKEDLIFGWPKYNNIDTESFASKWTFAS